MIIPSVITEGKIPQ